MWYKNIAGRFFGLVTKHACDRRTDGQNHDSQDRASIAASRGNNNLLVEGRVMLTGRLCLKLNQLTYAFPLNK